MKNSNTQRQLYFGKLLPWLLLFILLLASRLLTAIHYIEEPDSMRFALAIKEFDILKLQPHFPGYPVFCFLTKIFYLLTKSMSVSFAIMGSAGLFLSIFSATHICRLIFGEAFLGRRIYVLWAIMFFNPLLWVISNSYMPDSFGCGVTMLALYIFIYALKNNSAKAAIAFQFIAAILAGTRLSYLPMLLLPSIYLIWKFNKKPQQLLAGITGIFIWLLPMIWLTGFQNLIHAAQTHTEGHFADWGGSAVTEDNYFNRLLMFLRGVWADGFGGWWSSRSVITILTSVAILSITLAGFAYMGRLKNASALNKNNIIKWLFLCFAVYALWIFFGQNIVYKARHALPLLPLLSIFIYLLFEVIFTRNKKLYLALIIAFLVPYIFTAIIIAHQHTKPTAIAQTQQWLSKNAGPQTTVISIPLVNDYLRAHNIRAKFIDAETTEAAIQQIQNKNNVIYIGHLQPKLQKTVLRQQHFYHNPYVNRMWPHMAAYQY